MGSTYAVVTTVVTAAQLGKGGKAAVGGCQGEVITESHYVPPVLEWRMTKMNEMKVNDDAVPLRDFLLQ